MHANSASTVISAIESAWRAAQRHHAEVPDVVVVMGSGQMSRSGLRRGSHRPDRWTTAAGRVPELFIAGELLAEGGEAVLQTVLHEASHALAHVRGVQDTSRDGNRYHNKRFAEHAEELGLFRPARADDRGYSDCSLHPDTVIRYAEEVAALDAALGLYLEAGPRDRPSGRSGKRITIVCRCDRRLQVTPKTYEGGAIICGLCGSPFVP
ncbi:hypothetical protein [Pseudofrankia sp. BMG5.36]|uniref:hypothetical protein n=1 Tax=Pseudofrankia sp. BMG5.36 TaxID=1834512 RepID=UPI0008D9B653|nr:hypothetical protein [Pseudofrankia sp. BMG5.36]OHV61401.1 hypothetical protein BCD48_39740 [Pseudofrankia sp. BMG5.36]